MTQPRLVTQRQRVMQPQRVTQRQRVARRPVTRSQSELGLQLVASARPLAGQPAASASSGRASRRYRS